VQAKTLASGSWEYCDKTLYRHCEGLPQQLRSFAVTKATEEANKKYEVAETHSCDHDNESR